MMMMMMMMMISRQSKELFGEIADAAKASEGIFWGDKNWPKLENFFRIFSHLGRGGNFTN